MMVVDANVLIAFFSPSDAHFSDAVRLLEEFAAEGFTTNVLTVAEALVYPTRRGEHETVLQAFDAIGLSITALESDAHHELAGLRAEYGLRLPDAVVLREARATESMLMTFDAGLARAAREAGVAVVGVTA